MTSLSVQPGPLPSAHPGRGRAFDDRRDSTALWRRSVRRIYGTTTAHRALPWFVGRQLADAQAAVLWRSPATRAQAIAGIRFLLGHTDRAHEIDLLARRWLTESCRWAERLWRPWLTTHRPVHRLQVLREAIDTRRGVILSFAHLGDYYSVFPSLNRLGIDDLHVALAPSHFNSRRFMPVKGRRNAEMSGTRAFDAVGSFQHIARLLDEGATVGIACDIPGATPVTFLGRRVGAASGTARLALVTGALVLPITATASVPHAHQPLCIGDPIDPAGYDAPGPLLQAVVAAHEASVLAWPEGLQFPLERWHDLQD